MPTIIRRAFSCSVCRAPGRYRHQDSCRDERHAPQAKAEGCSEMGGATEGEAGAGMGSYPGSSFRGEDCVKKLPRIKTAKPVIHGVLKLVFTDGYEGVVDLRPIIARGRIFTWLQRRKNFQKVQLEEYGHHVF